MTVRLSSLIFMCTALLLLWASPPRRRRRRVGRRRTEEERLRAWGAVSGRIHTLTPTNGKSLTLHGTTSMCERHDAKSDQYSAAVLNSFTASTDAGSGVDAD